MPRRPATTEEKRLLARLGRPHPMWIVVSAGWPVAMLFLTALGLYYLVTGTRTLAQSLFVLLVGVGGLAGYLYLRRLFARSAAADRSSGQRDLEAGEVDETQFEIVDAIEVAEEEDEGRHFYLRLADGRVLFLSGQYLYEPVASKRFPAARITMIRAPTSGIVLSMRPEGEFLAPSAVRPSFSEREHARGRVPDDGEIIETDFDRLRRRA
jgi:hypothetical protein